MTTDHRPPTIIKLSVVGCRSSLLQLYLDIDARRQVELHQSVDRLLARIQHIDQALVRANLKLLLGIFIDERRTDDAILLNLGWQRYRPSHQGTSSLGRLDDLPCRL